MCAFADHAVRMRGLSSFPSGHGELVGGVWSLNLQLQLEVFLAPAPCVCLLMMHMQE